MRRVGGDRGVVRLNDFMSPMLERMGLAKACREHMAIHLWKDVVGPHVARNTAAVAVRGGVLFVKTASHAWMSELARGFRHSYLEAINARLGEALIQDIRFQPPPLPAPSETTGEAPDLPLARLDEDEMRGIEEFADTIEDVEMRRRIRRIIKRALQRDKTRQQAGWKPCPGCGGLNEDGTRCKPCRQHADEERRLALHRLFHAKPWLSTPEIKLALPEVTFDELEREKRRALHGLRDQIKAWHERARPEAPMPPEISGAALKYAMLRTGKPPLELTHVDLQYALGKALARRLGS